MQSTIFFDLLQNEKRFRIRVFRIRNRFLQFEAKKADGGNVAAGVVIDINIVYT